MIGFHVQALFLSVIALKFSTVILPVNMRSTKARDNEQTQTPPRPRQFSLSSLMLHVCSPRG